MTKKTSKTKEMQRLVVAQALSADERHELVSRKAYQFFEQRGAAHGQDWVDWFAAEQWLRETLLEEHNLKKEYSIAEFVATLRQLADALEGSGTFALESWSESISIPAEAKCKAEHEREGKKEELELQIKWANS